MRKYCEAIVRLYGDRKRHCLNYVKGDDKFCWKHKKKTGCSACDKLIGDKMCLKHELEHADYKAEHWMKRVEEIKQKIKEQEDAESSVPNPRPE